MGLMSMIMGPSGGFIRIQGGFRSVKKVFGVRGGRGKFEVFSN